VSRKKDYPWWDEKKWLAVRPLIIERDGYACTNCGDTGEDKNNPLTVDHVYPLALFNDDDITLGRAYDPNNLTTLCNICNGTKKHHQLVRTSGRNPRFYKMHDSFF
jgi:5-methylcytosine-specific restriction endonuclease McrA